MPKNLYTEQEYEEWCELLGKVSAAESEAETFKAYEDLKKWELAAGMNAEKEGQMLNELFETLHRKLSITNSNIEQLLQISDNTSTIKIEKEV